MFVTTAGHLQEWAHINDYMIGECHHFLSALSRKIGIVVGYQ